MDRRGKRRGIRHIHIFKIFHLRAQGYPGHRDIHDLIHGACAKHLHAEQFMRRLIRHQLDDKTVRPRIVMGLVIHYRKDGFRVIPRRLCLPFGQPRLSDIQPRQFYNAGSKATRILLFFSIQHLRESSSGIVGGGTHG